MYLLAGVRRPVLVQQRPLLWPWRHWSWHQLEFAGRLCWLWNSPWKLELVAKHSLPVESRLGLTVTDCLPSSGCAAAALSDSESARLALQLFTGILDHDLFCCSCKLELTVDPPASTGGRQVGLDRKPAKRLGKLGRSKIWAETRVWNFSRFKFSCALWLANFNHHDWS